MTATRRSRPLMRALLAHVEARPRVRRAIVRALNRFPAVKRALKASLAYARTPAVDTVAISRSDIPVDGLSSRAARVLVDLDRARAAEDGASHDGPARPLM